MVAVALDSPGLSFKAVIGHLAAQGGNPLPGAVGWVAGQMLPRLVRLPLEQAEVMDVFSTFPGPLFIAHGAADRIVPIQPSQDLAASRPTPTISLWTGADHLGSYGEDPAEYRSAFMGFLQNLGT